MPKKRITHIKREKNLTQRKKVKKNSIKPNNPTHKEDFNKLLEKAAKPHQK